MALPGNVSVVTLQGTYVDIDGNACAGTVYFTPNVDRLRDPSADTVIISKTKQAILDGSGAFSITLVATDDTDLVPNGWKYKVREDFTTPSSHDREYEISLPALPSTANLADLAPA